MLTPILALLSTGQLLLGTRALAQMPACSHLTAVLAARGMNVAAEALAASGYALVATAQRLAALGRARPLPRPNLVELINKMLSLNLTRSRFLNFVY